ncbi:uncharacterized protein CANTADRAFT_50229 [Suhomyces tanzawaensis NRRL Y-17324]|uniref:glucan endo-1,3-beta-D-glucosidase n=1 Tax=Suhomyces tanzawaensis NRRL Y-17324 TaxID=984487 RepID=A0A1E4SJL6_9ASCO|nr:uncharacterized protein CANTADRAFT_50229 [Suhomyces tanzawaensis NRRL Y-17324]ODV79694.1 hypothetical protein CANTADRAFT_50229 [Suhomyces tanzawaensis NRRL Y-17324]
MRIDTLVLAAGIANGVQGASSHFGNFRRASEPQSNVLQFQNFGYSGRYQMVAELNDVDSDSCSCALSNEPVAFSGVNSPINEEVSVHFRGPLVLSQFAVYVADNFVHGQNSSSDWSRIAYYDGSSSAAENVTFLTTAGDDSKCLGKALTYAGTKGTDKASSATVLPENVLLNSNDEYSIFSNITCQSLGLNNDCGVYRSGIPAYHGFYGTVKTFLFEFTMPNDTTSDTSISNYNMPAIWLLNAHIPRTAQYSLDANCSCWRSGCGEFDIFEVKNTTQAGQLFTTIHDYQGTGDIETGIQIDGFIPRKYNETVKGGVSFDSKGNTVVWVSNSTSFGSTIKASDLNGWVSGAGTPVTEQLASASLAPASSSNTRSSSKKNDGTVANPNSVLNRIAIGLVSGLIWFF